MFEKATAEDYVGMARGAKPKWPMAMMEVGDKVIIKHGQYGKSNPQIYPHIYGHQTGKKFMTKTMDDRSIMVIRIA